MWLTATPVFLYNPYAVINGAFVTMTNEQTNDVPQTEAPEYSSVSDIAQEGVFLEMAKAGVLYGHKKSRKDPHFGEFVFAIRNGVEIIDLEQTVSHIDEMAEKLSQLKKDGKSVMVVGTQPAARESVKRLAETLESPYVVNKWIGGLITNFPVISERIEYFKKQKESEKNNKFSDYTKKERLMIHREIEKMTDKFEGLDGYTRTPDAMFLIDGSIKGHKAALREARRKDIPVFGIIDNDDNPELFDNIIPANDHARSAIEWVVNDLVEKIT